METTSTNQISEEQMPDIKPGIYNPVAVNVQDSIGMLVLGIISIMLLIGWVKTEQRNRQLLSR